MTAQHTPGPWHVNGERSIWAKNDRVAKMDQADGGGETLANARLIATAPELLKELDNLVRFLSESNDVDLAAARAVINKARGQ